MTTKVQCTVCGRIIESTTVTKKVYKKGEIIDFGCPYDGALAPLSAVSAKKKKTKVSEENTYLGHEAERDIDESEPV